MATVVVLVVLTIAAVVLFFIQRDELSENIDVSLSERADAIEELLVGGSLPQSIVGDDEDRLVQVVDTDGRILIASEQLQGLPPLVDLASGANETTTEIGATTLGDQPFRVLSRQVPSGAIVHVAESTDDLQDTTSALVTTLLLIVPAIAVAFAGLSWLLVGRTLQPVEDLRAKAAAISDTRDLRPLPPPQRNDEIGRLTTTLNEMLNRLRTSSEQQRRFVADAAHELRTPLTRIRTTVEVDLAQPATADPKRTNLDVQHEAIGMQRLIDDLLHLAAGDNNTHRATSSRFDLDDVVTDEVRQHRGSHPQLTIDSTGIRACEFHGDEAQVRRAIQNLLANACRYASNIITVVLREHDGLIELTIADDGPGIPADQRETIFDRFARLDEARAREHGGAGLGLAITRDIVERHGGTIEVGPSPLGGARFAARFSTKARS